MTAIETEGLAKASIPLSSSVEIPQTPLFDPLFLVSELRKALVLPAASNQGRNPGRVAHPINMQAAIDLKQAVNIQEVCILTKRDAIVGLGFETEEERQAREAKKQLEQTLQSQAMGNPPGKPGQPSPPPSIKKEFPPAPANPKADPSASDPNKQPEPGTKPRSKVEEVLDPLCEDGFQTLLNKVGEDYEDTGNGYIEVVRETPDGPVAALWHMPAAAPFVYNEANKINRHFECDDIGGTLKYAKWGDAARVKTLAGSQTIVTELIHFKQPSNRHPVYGMPSWTSCVPWLELAQMVMQYDFDYFQNRAVPDLMLLITGRAVDQKDMDKLKESIKETVGAKKRHRSIIANIPVQDAEVVLERLQADNREDFQALWSMIQLATVSTHRIPPLLAGVTIPGRMAAVNELPNALIAFQTLYIGQHQRIFEFNLARTLGTPEAGLGLKPTDFLLKKITDFYDMGQVDTMSRMRETATNAQLEGRKLQDGLKK
jgi:hypothetical protein